MTTSQLCFLRCLLKRPFEASLADAILARCGSDGDELSALRGAGLVRERRGVLEMTDAGRAAYAKEKRGRWF